MLVGLVVLISFNVVKIEKIFEILKAVKPVWILVIVTLQILTYISLSRLWLSVANKGGFRIPAKSLARLAIEKFAVDQLVPTAGVAGNLVVVRVMKKLGVPQPIAIEALALDMMAYYGSFALLGIALMLLLWIHYSTLFIVPVLLGCFSAVMVLLVLIIWKIVNHQEENFPAWLRKLKAVQSFSRFIEGVSEERMSSKSLLAAVFFYQLMIFLLDALTLWAIFQALNVNVSFLISLIGFILAAIGGLISLLPGGIGIFEASGVSALVFLGVPFEAAITGTLLLRAFTLWLPLIPGVLFAYHDHVAEN